MAAHFVGLSMLVTLNAPPGLQLRGIVSNVVPGESLTLRDGKLCSIVDAHLELKLIVLCSSYFTRWRQVL